MTTLTARDVMTGAAILQLIADHAGLTPRDFSTGAWLDKLDPALDITARDIVTGAYVQKLNLPAPPDGWLITGGYYRDGELVYNGGENGGLPTTLTAPITNTDSLAFSVPTGNFISVNIVISASDVVDTATPFADAIGFNIYGGDNVNINQDGAVQHNVFGAADYIFTATLSAAGAVINIATDEGAAVAEHVLTYDLSTNPLYLHVLMNGYVGTVLTLPLSITAAQER